MFKLSVDWPAALIWCTFSWESGKKWLSVTVLYLVPVCVMCVVHCLQWTDWSELLTSVCSESIVSRPGQVLIAQPSNSTVYSSWCTEISGICIEWINNTCCHCSGFIRKQRSGHLLWWVGWRGDLDYVFNGIQYISRSN